MDEQKALQLTKSNEILRAAEEAEARNCEQHIISQLYENYYAACKKEQGYN